MKKLAFELGFDWNVPPIQGIRDGVFPLQMALVDPAHVISPYNPSVVRVGNTLSFRVYDFTDPAFPPDDSPSPKVLQVLFTSATTVESSLGEPPPPFSPVNLNDEPVAQLTSTSFSTPSKRSIAFDVGAGWDVTLLDLGSEVTFDRDGRFNFRALLTVAFPGQMARFYRADPEMVIGPPGGQG